MNNAKQGTNGQVSDCSSKGMPDSLLVEGLNKDFSDSRENQEENNLQRLLNEANHKNEILSAISKLFWQVFEIDLHTNECKEVFTNDAFVIDNPLHFGLTDEIFNRAIDRFVDEAYREQMVAFSNHKTLPERLASTNSISIEYRAKQGFWISAHYIVQTRDKNGEVSKVLFVLQDIDKQKRKEFKYREKLEQIAEEARKANEAKTNFLRRMSHDIRTPLNGIIGLINIDKAHFDDLDLVKENHRKMLISANHLLSLINDVLQMSKLEEGNNILTREFIGLYDLTQDIVNIVIDRAVDAGIEWDFEKEKSVIPYPYIYGSPVHLRQIFLNIYGNCIKYNHCGGKITTIVDTLEDREGFCTYRWIITDTGIGMNSEFLEHIFDPFAQERNDAKTAHQGIGLGMAIVKGLLDQMGGTISVTSEEGVGSRFEVVIPFEIAPAPAVLSDVSFVPKADICGLSLLLVEDNELNAEIAQILLTDEGARVTLASNGEQAVNSFEESNIGEYDAILMDVMMPVMNGYEAAKRIRSLNRADAKDTPIIAMTANAFQEDIDLCFEAGMNAHIAKPIDMEKLKQTIWAVNN